MNDFTPIAPSTDASFNEITQLIVAARQRAMQAVNTELIELHWQVGAYISRKIEAAEWAMGWLPNWLPTRAHSAGIAWFHTAKFVSHASVL